MLDDALAIARASDDDLLRLRRRTESTMEDAPAREAAMRRAHDLGTLMERFRFEATAALSPGATVVPASNEKNAQGDAGDAATLCSCLPAGVVFPDTGGWTATIVDGKPTASFRASLERLRDVLDEAEREARDVEEDTGAVSSSYSDYSDSDTRSSRSGSSGRSGSSVSSEDASNDASDDDDSQGSDDDDGAETDETE